MTTVFRRKHYCEIDLDAYKKETVSTFLIPEKIAKKLRRICPSTYAPKKGRTYQFAFLLNKLINKYRGWFAIGEIPFNKNPKLLYQEKGQNLQTFKFRPRNVDWFELGILANGVGVTKCWLFTYLLTLELSLLRQFTEKHLFEKIISAPRASRPRVIYQIYGNRRFIQRILHFRI